MRGTRRQTVIHLFEIAGASLVLLDVLLYFVMLRPVLALASSEQQQFAALRRRIFDGQVRLEQLNQFQEALPEAGKRLATFKQDHTPPRRQGFSQADKLVRRLTEEAGIQRKGVAYKLDTSTSAPLLRLNMVITVEGPFPGLLKFGHALETASDFIVLRSFNIAPGEGGVLDLRLVADLYLTP